VEVDEAGEAGGLVEVDGLRAGHRGQVLADGGDALSRDLDDDRRQRLIATAVDQAAASDEHDGLRRDQGRAGRGGEREEGRQDSHGRDYRDS